MCDGSYPEFLKVEKRKAIKNHACNECGFLIKKGTHYFKVVGKWEGYLREFKHCWFCDAMTERLNDMEEGNACYGGIYEGYYNMRDWVGFAAMPFLLISDKEYCTEI